MRHFSRHSISFITIVAGIIGLLSTTQCGGSSTSPTASGAVSGVTLSATSVTVAGSATGTVTLSAPAPAGGATVALASSNTGVATVPASVTVAAGSSSIGFIVVAVAPGSAAVTASMNGSSSQSPALTVTARAALASIALSTGSIVGGETVNGTITLSAAAPAGGASVSLSGTSPVVVVSSVTVPAGSSSATFSASTGAVSSTVVTTITASYGGDSKSAQLSLTAPTAATASFGVTGATESETCALANGGNTLNCTFNGSTSTAPGPIVSWEWTYGVAGATTFSQRTTGAVLTQPAVNCSFLPPPPLPAAPADQFFKLTVTLKVTDSLGNVSAVASNPNARVFPSGTCGF